MLSYPPYSKLLKQVRGRIYGTWDDHDYGLNDAGKYLDDKESRKLLYLNFLNVNSDDVRRNRDGVYHTINIKENRENVKVIFLDTRTFRENHYIPSVGGIPFPLSPVIAAFSRFLVKMLGLGKKESVGFSASETFLQKRCEIMIYSNGSIEERALSRNTTFSAHRATTKTSVRVFSGEYRVEVIASRNDSWERLK